MFDFHRLYLSHIDAIYPSLATSDGIAPSRIISTEQRLNIRLPQALRTYYRLAGNRADINASQNILIAPEHLTVTDAMIIFYQENQSVFYGVSVLMIYLLTILWSI